jgi:hypothetical protein
VTEAVWGQQRRLACLAEHTATPGPEPVALDLLTDHPNVSPDRLAGTVALVWCVQLVQRRALATVAPPHRRAAPRTRSAAARRTA